MKALLFLVIVGCIVGFIAATEEKCLASAGYTWCPYENKCVRPWEIAKEKGLENTRENIATYCNLKRPNETKPNHMGVDAHGCIASAGYSWCEKESKCVRPWELAKEIGLDSSPRSFFAYCSKPNAAIPSHAVEGGVKDDHGCLSAAGYVWCGKDEKCIRPWELSKEKGIAMTPASINKYCSTCISSAGYSWCEKEHKCVRPWELATLRNIENTPESFESYCSGVSTPVVHIGGSSDSHGCLASAGYTWCSVENKCVRSWELSKEKGFENTVDNVRQYCAGLAVVTSLPNPQSSSDSAVRKSEIGGGDAHGCIAGAGYSWCAREKRCVRPWELAVERNIDNTPSSISTYCAVPHIGGASGAHGCIAGAGYTWCEKESKCVRPWELAKSAAFENTRESFESYCAGN